MKKSLFAALLCCLAVGSASAQDVIEVAPVSMGASVTLDDDNASFDIVITSSRIGEISGVGMDLYIPDGLIFDGDYYTEGDLMPKKGKNYKHTIDCQAYEPINQDMPGFTRYLLNVFSMSGDFLVGESGGTLVSFTLGSSDAEGVYPIYFKNIKLKKSPLEAVAEIKAESSYVKVGNPTSASVAMEGIVSDLVNKALSTEAAITSLDLTNVTASYGTFTYVDGRDVVAPSAAVSAKVAYKHSTGSNSYCSVCLPFDATVANAFTFDKIEGESAKFVEASTLAAGTSAIVKGDIDVAGTAEIAAVAGETITTGYYLKNDKFLSVKGSAVIPAMRGNWKSISGVKGFIIDGEETAINAIDAEGAQDIYSVAGIKQAKVQKGVNIVNGKKLYVK